AAHPHPGGGAGRRCGRVLFRQAAPRRGRAARAPGKRDALRARTYRSSSPGRVSRAGPGVTKQCWAGAGVDQDGWMVPLITTSTTGVPTAVTSSDSTAGSTGKLHSSGAACAKVANSGGAPPGEPAHRDDRDVEYDRGSRREAENAEGEGAECAGVSRAATHTPEASNEGRDASAPAAARRLNPRPRPGPISSGQPRRAHHPLHRRHHLLLLARPGVDHAALGVEHDDVGRG